MSLTFRYPQGNYQNPINYYSGPNVKDESGAILGNEMQDNERIINERRFLVAANGDEKIPCPGKQYLKFLFMIALIGPDKICSYAG